MHKWVLIAAVAMVFSYSGAVMAADGEALYKKTCHVCHGLEGEGKAMMGPVLMGNEFVKTADDAAMKDLLINGRVGANKKFSDMPMPMMPQKFTDEEVAAITKYMRDTYAK